ncbi:hypothetical protein H4219_004318 [Mycoemilia scoparia]|uniref:Amino acid transporter transmembrane domain-containing protein n=1 Tax=Mycoemilia scoparia TaxID=417184 RepID=A0A9W8A075_9FUNG|nr:hypothetical protein H4219_004318 [Mycoemilia scoparia]
MAAAAMGKSGEEQYQSFDYEDSNISSGSGIPQFNDHVYAPISQRDNNNSSNESRSRRSNGGGRINDTSHLNFPSTSATSTLGDDKYDERGGGDYYLEGNDDHYDSTRRDDTRYSFESSEFSEIQVDDDDQQRHTRRGANNRGRSSSTFQKSLEYLPASLHSGASKLASFFNLTNAIVGAGVIGLPYAVEQSGFLVGITLIVTLAYAVNWTLRLLAYSSKMSSQNTYQDLVGHCFGSWGLAVNSFFQFTMAFGGMASFIVIVGDTLPHVLSSLLPSVADTGFGGFLFSRRVIIFLFVVCLAYPLSLYRNIGSLAKTSAFAVVAMLTIIISVLIEGPRIDTEYRPDPGAPIKLFGTGFFESVGVITFAFVCHHNSFMIYGSLKKPTLNRYFDVVLWASVFACVVSLTIGMGGYLIFKDKTRGNILTNFPTDNFLINVARFLFALNMITTFPLETFVAREVIESLITKPNTEFSLKRHVIITTALCLPALIIGEVVCDLGFLLEITGGLSASTLAFILPAACYLKLASGPLWHWSKVPHWLCIVFGFVVMILSTVLAIVKASKNTHKAGSCWN